MLPLMSARQLLSLQARIQSPRWYIDEQLWSFLVASLIAEAPQKQIPLFCEKAMTLSAGCAVACEAEPISTRHGSKEGNTVLDIAFGHIGARGHPVASGNSAAQFFAGIAYSPVGDDSWVCFVEAKVLSDASGSVTRDPLRNQLTRVIENLLCFQAVGKHPNRLHFALLTPRVFYDNPTARLYGYKMRDYCDHEAILKDIDRCELPRRCTSGYTFPELRSRLQALAPLQWVTFEDVLVAAGFAKDLDVVRRPAELAGVQAAIAERLAARLPAVPGP